MSEWISVEARLPEYDTEVLVSGSEGVEVAKLLPREPDQPDSMGHDGGFCGLYAFPGRSFGNPEYYSEPQGQPTHWMPLPEPPK